MGTSAPVKVHMGSGDKVWPGFVNIDKYSARADVHCDCLSITMETDSVDELHAIHLLEHLHRRDAVPALAEWARVLKPGGLMVLELPCLDKMARLIVEGEQDLRFTVLGLYGDPRDPKPGMLHQWGWSIAELTDALTQAGLSDVTVQEPVFHFAKRDMRIEARKPC